VKSRQSSRTKSATGGTTVTKALQLGTAATPLGFFTWADTVNVGTNSVSTANIIVSPLVTESQQTQSDGNNEDAADLEIGEGAQRAVYTFDVVHPPSIEWDPELGYSGNMNGATSIAALASRSMTAIAIVASALLAFFTL